MTNFLSKPESRHVVVLYDKRTGEIRHIHEEISLAGSKVSNRRQIEDAAFKQVQILTNQIKEQQMREVHSMRSMRASELAPLHVSDIELKPYANYRVDLKRKRIIEVNKKVTNRTKEKTRRKST